MINLELLTMEEYQPIHGQWVTLVLKNPLRMLQVQCEVMYQGYNHDGATPVWSSNTTEKMLEIPFNKPFIHLVGEENENGVNPITGFKLLDDCAVSRIESASKMNRDIQYIRNYLEPDDEDYDEVIKELDEMMKPYVGIPLRYWKKEWLFVSDCEPRKQIHWSDEEDEVLGIVNEF